MSMCQWLGFWNPHERVQSETHVHNFDVCDSRVFQYCFEFPVSQFSQETNETFLSNVDLDLPTMPAPRKRSSEHVAEHTVDDLVPLVVKKKLDGALQLFDEDFTEKQAHVDRCIRELKRAKEILRLVAKSPSLVCPRDIERIQGEIQDGKYSHAVALRDLYACREQSELFKRRRISRCGYEVLSLTGTDSRILRCDTDIESICFDKRCFNNKSEWLWSLVLERHWLAHFALWYGHCVRMRYCR